MLLTAFETALDNLLSSAFRGRREPHVSQRKRRLLDCISRAKEEIAVYEPYQCANFLLSDKDRTEIVGSRKRKLQQFETEFQNLEATGVVDYNDVFHDKEAYTFAVWCGTVLDPTDALPPGLEPFKGEREFFFFCKCFEPFACPLAPKVQQCTSSKKNPNAPWVERPSMNFEGYKSSFKNDFNLNLSNEDEFKKNRDMVMEKLGDIIARRASAQARGLPQNGAEESFERLASSFLEHYAIHEDEYMLWKTTEDTLADHNRAANADYIADQALVQAHNANIGKVLCLLHKAITKWVHIKYALGRRNTTAIPYAPPAPPAPPSSGARASPARPALPGAPTRSAPPAAHTRSTPAKWWATGGSSATLPPDPAGLYRVASTHPTPADAHAWPSRTSPPAAPAGHRRSASTHSTLSDGHAWSTPADGHAWSSPADGRTWSTPAADGLTWSTQADVDAWSTPAYGHAWPAPADGHAWPARAADDVEEKEDIPPPLPPKPAHLVTGYRQASSSDADDDFQDAGDDFQDADDGLQDADSVFFVGSPRHPKVAAWPIGVNGNVIAPEAVQKSLKNEKPTMVPVSADQYIAGQKGLGVNVQVLPSAEDEKNEPSQEPAPAIPPMFSFAPPKVAADLDKPADRPPPKNADERIQYEIQDLASSMDVEKAPISDEVINKLLQKLPQETLDKLGDQKRDVAQAVLGAGLQAGNISRASIAQSSGLDGVQDNIRNLVNAFQLLDDIGDSKIKTACEAILEKALTNQTKLRDALPEYKRLLDQKHLRFLVDHRVQFDIDYNKFKSMYANNFENADSDIRDQLRLRSANASTRFNNFVYIVLNYLNCQNKMREGKLTDASLPEVSTLDKHELGVLILLFNVDSEGKLKPRLPPQHGDTFYNKVMNEFEKTKRETHPSYILISKPQLVVPTAVAANPPAVQTAGSPRPRPNMADLLKGAGAPKSPAKTALAGNPLVQAASPNGLLAGAQNLKKTAPRAPPAEKTQNGDKDVIGELQKRISGRRMEGVQDDSGRERRPRRMRE